MFEPRRRSAFYTMRLFEEYFSEKSVIRELCKARVSLAEKRNDMLFLHRISKDSPSAENAKIASNMVGILDIFPPRRKWHQFRPRHRGKSPAADLNLETLFRACLTLRKLTPNERWVAKLEARVDGIRSRVLSTRTFRFNKPRINPVVKSAVEKTFRPIAAFSLDDKIVDSLTARYFRDMLDAELLPSCLAFRCSKGKKPPPTIHDALEKVLEFNRACGRTRPFVAECDIKGFFDCVAHDVALQGVRSLIADAKKRNHSLAIDKRALRVLHAYLDAYSFSNDVAVVAQASLQKRYLGAKFKWPKDDLERLHKKGALPRIGVPQGGALSCLIANAVLHKVDKTLENLRKKLGMSSFTYLRYCDDMILLARSQAVCAKAFSCYCRSVKRLRLPIHPPGNVGRYSRSFWDGKSRAPFRWAKPRGAGKVPWIQFVGYQVRYDALVRVRLSSLKKHIRKLTESADELLATLSPGRWTTSKSPAFAQGLRKSAHQVRHRFRQKLISISVGRREICDSLDEMMGMCWANGFRGLKDKRIVTSSLKALDRHRERQIQRIARRVKPLTAKKGKSEVRKVLRYYGFPFSYWGQFLRIPRPSKRKN